MGQLPQVISQTNSPQPIPGLGSALLKAQTNEQIRPHLDIFFSSETAQQIMTLNDHANATS